MDEILWLASLEEFMIHNTSQLVRKPYPASEIHVPSPKLWQSH